MATVSSRCNNSCVVCAALGKLSAKDADALPKDAVLACSSEMHPRFMDMLQKMPGKSVVLESNARMFAYSSYAESAGPYLKEVRVLLFGQNEKEHDANTRTKGSYAQAMAGIRNLGKYRIPFAVTTVFSPAETPVAGVLQEIVLELTHACNLDCKACFNKSGKSEQMLDSDLAKAIIDSCKGLLRTVRFSGGEPLLRKDLFGLMEYAKEKGFAVWLNTNATLVTRENARKIAGLCENVLIPFNGWDRMSDSQWSGKDEFEGKLKGVRFLSDASVPVLRAGTVATRENVRNLGKIRSLTKNLSSWELYRPIPVTRQEELDASLLAERIAEISLEMGSVVPVANSIPFCMHDMDAMNALCLGAASDDGHARMVVDPAGFVKPSYFINENLGSPLDLLACWNHDFMKKMRELRFLPEVCKSCNYKDKCRGGSRYAAWRCNGSYSAKDPLMP